MSRARSIPRTSIWSYEGNLAVLGAGSVRRRARARRAAVQEPRRTRATKMRTRHRPGHGDRLESRSRRGITNATATRINIPTPQGVLPFRIAAIYYDYSSDRGVVVMDRGTFRKYFGELPATGRGGYLKPGADPEKVRGEMLDMHRRGPSRVHLQQQHAARRDPAGLRQHVRDHLRARADRDRWSPCSAWPGRC